MTTIVMGTTGQGQEVFRFGTFEIDERKFALTRAGAAVDVPPRVYDLIVYLIRNCDRSAQPRPQAWSDAPAR